MLNIEELYKRKGKFSRKIQRENDITLVKEKNHPDDKLNKEFKKTRYTYKLYKNGIITDNNFTKFITNAVSGRLGIQPTHISDNIFTDGNNTYEVGLDGTVIEHELYSQFDYYSDYDCGYDWD